MSVLRLSEGCVVGRVLGVRSRVVGGGCVWWWSCVGVWRVGFGCFLSLCSADRRDWFWWLLCLFVRGYFSCVYLRGRSPYPQKKPTPLSTGGEGTKAHLPVHARAGKITPASAIPRRTDVPLSALSPSPAGWRGGLWSAETKLPPTLKLRFSTPNGTACGSPLAHAEGLEVRAKEDVPYGRA